MIVDDSDDSKPRVIICAGTACQASGSNGALRVAKRYILENELLDRVALRITGCHGFCEMGPFILTEPQKAFYSKVETDDVPRIIESVLENEYVEDLLYSDPVTGEVFRNFDDIPFFKHQKRSLLEMNQKLDPIRIYDYIRQGGYGALRTVLSGHGAEWVVEQVKSSGLRGRGGAGFPTGMKWELLAQQRNGKGKFLVCNADEGDPGAYMDRSILEGNPHSIIEGMIIGAYGTAATHGVVYVRNEYPLAIKHLTIALRRCHDLGLLGEDILGTGLSFDIEIVRGAGAFVCGEETALIRSIEGKMGEPRQRPPFPIEKGIDGQPTVINNVETWANIPLIVRLGAGEFAKIGTKRNTGTKVFSLVGKIKNTGLVEVPMGITIDQIVNEIGGGPPGKAKIKAVQTGGPSGGCIPARMFDLPIDYDSLAKAGSIMGSGGMIVMDENTCIIDVAKYFMNFLKNESCGKCFTCRKGTQRMHEILDDISRGRGTAEDLTLLEELAEAVRDTTMCGLGQSAPNPVLSTLKYFREEYEQHVKQKRCNAFVCKELVGAPCAVACPVGTEVWRYVALIAREEYEEAYNAIRKANPFPSVCARVCSHPCESQCRSGTGGKLPIAIRALKRFVTDRVDPSSYQEQPIAGANGKGTKVAIIGSGPAGLAAAHYLSTYGYAPTVFEADDRPGGMLVSGIPSFRLPREVLGKEIDALIAGGISVQCNKSLGRDITTEGLFDDGFKAVFIAIGAHDSRKPGLEGEECEGMHYAMSFLKAFNLRGQQLARGRVAVIGGGNSAIDAARVAIRQEAVESVTILYRRTREEMPAFEEEIEAALTEGIELQTLVSPVRISTDKGRIAGVKMIRNSLGDRGPDGRRRPVPISGSETELPFDTVIVAISERPGTSCLANTKSQPLEIMANGQLRTEPATLMTARPGVFAGGDVATGPNTVIDAIAAGKKAAVMIRRYLEGEQLDQPGVIKLPEAYVEPALLSEDELVTADRVEIPELDAASRHHNHSEVELSLSAGDATREARRCLRCDLEFTRPKAEKTPRPAVAREN
jgi:NADH-quinone oxidoreductase subunit F